MPFYEITGQGKESGRKRKPRRYFAKNDAIAIRQAHKDGIEVESVDLLDVCGCVTSIAGCSHRNADNTSRQNLLKKCKPGDFLTLEHEIGNRHDKHAVKVMRTNGEQLGYMPQGVAKNLIEGYWTPSGCDYWALIIGVEMIDDSTDLQTARILVLVSLPGTVNAQEGIKRELSQLRITAVSPESVNWQPLRGVQYEPRRRDEKADQKAGCLGIIILAVCAIVSLLVFLLN